MVGNSGPLARDRKMGFGYDPDMYRTGRSSGPVRFTGYISAYDRLDSLAMAKEARVYAAEECKHVSVFDPPHRRDSTI